eukprot:m.84096 g.84096  ORF g.84096 m.84096 type:complete len:121 (+) comp25708_c0_seq1:113-475(+)
MIRYLCQESRKFNITHLRYHNQQPLGLTNITSLVINDLKLNHQNNHITANQKLSRKTKQKKQPKKKTPRFPKACTTLNNRANSHNNTTRNNNTFNHAFLLQNSTNVNLREGCNHVSNCQC